MDVSNIGSIKSTAGIINQVVNAINDEIVGNTEQLSNDPPSFLNLQLDTIGAICSANFYEMLITKREAVKSTAMTKRSLVRYLSADEFTGILGSPANFNFMLGFTLSDLILYSIVITTDGNGNPTLKQMTINKTSTISLMTYPDFTFDYYIDIYSKFTGADKSDPLNYSNPNNYTFYGQYRETSSSVVPAITNPFVKSSIVNYNGILYFMMNIPTKQYVRNITEYQSLIVSNMDYEYDLNYSDSLYGFEVFYKESDNVDYSLLTGQPDGVFNSEGFNFSIKSRNNGQSSITFKFHRDPNNFAPANGSSLQFIIYTTKGTGGNFVIPNWTIDTPPINTINFNQDRTIGVEDALLSTTPAITIAGGTSSGGSDEYTVDELRSLVISKSNAKNITIPELQDQAIAQGLILQKERVDILEIYFKLIGYIEYNGNEIATIPGFINLDISNGKVPYSAAVEAFMLTPNTFFEIESNDVRFTNDISLVTNPDGSISPSRAMIDYIKAYNNKLGIVNDYFFPYFMKITLGSFVDAEVYDQVINAQYSTLFEYYNEGSTSIAGINYITVNRDPSVEKSSIDSVTGNLLYSGKYIISFDLQVNSLMYTSLSNFVKGNSSLSDADMKIYITLTGSSTSYFVSNDKVILSLYPTGSDNDINNILQVLIELDTDSSIDSYERLRLINGSVLPNPRPNNAQPEESCFIDNTLEMKIYISFRGTTQSNIPTYIGILTSDDLSDPNGAFLDISAVYRVENIILFNNITDMIKPTIDIKLDQNNLYETYTQNIQALYSSTIIATNSSGVEIFDDISIVSNGQVIDTKVPRIIHRINDPMIISIIKDPLVSVSGPISLSLNSNAIFNFTTDSSYSITNVNVDGVDKGPITTVEFDNVIIGHSIVITGTDSNNTYVTSAIETDIPIYAHEIGDIIKDVNGNPSINPSGGTTIICEIVDLPLVDRIYFGTSGYSMVKSAFDDLSSRISALMTYAPTGTSAKLGVFDTVGGGGYQFIDKTMNNIQTPLDRMALSISIGAKLDSDIDSSTATTLIINEILSYIRNNSTSLTLSFAEMLDDVKTNIVGIKYLELYSINDYAIGACQSIFLPSGSAVQGVITVKSIVDYSNSDIVNNKLVFKPDIDVVII